MNARQWPTWATGRGEAIQVPSLIDGVCIDFGGYLLKVRPGVIWLENANGEGMHVKSEDMRQLLDTLFQEKF